MNVRTTAVRFKQTTLKNRTLSEDSGVLLRDSSVLDELNQQRLRQAIQDGLPLTAQPYKTLAIALGVQEDQVMNTIQLWSDTGLIKRMGLVVKHHSLGYRANAMVVWDVSEDQVDRVGEILSQCDVVTLCYQRPRRLPEWRYNLFSMIHGKNRALVLEQLADLVAENQLDAFPREVLFSYRLFKQCGGHYSKRSSLRPGNNMIEGQQNLSMVKNNAQVAYG